MTAKTGGRRASSTVRGAKATAFTGVIFPVQVAAAVARAVTRAITAAVAAAAVTGGAGVAGCPAGHGIAVTAAPTAHAGTLFQHRAAGLLDIFRLDLPQKAAGLVALGAAVQHPGDAVGDVQLLFGAGDTDVSQTALFFQICFGVLAHLAGENALLHADEEHIRELQTLGRVDGHQHHLIAALVVAVDITDEGDILQIAFQCGFLAVLVAVVFDVVYQLAKVLQTVGGILVPLGGVCFQHGLVAGQLDDIRGKLIQRAGGKGILQALVDLPELEQRHDRAGELGVLVGMADDIQHTDPLLPGKVCNDVNGGGTDLAGGLVDDAAQPHIVPGVGHDGHIGVDVLDLLAVVEALPAHDLMRDARAGEVAFDGSRLGVHAVEDGVVCQMAARLQVLADNVRDMAGFILLVLGGVHLHLITLAIIRPQGLALALGVVLDDTVGCVEDVGGGAVVLLQTDGLGAGVEFFKVEDIFNGSAAETVDALVVIAHHADVALRPGEQTDQTELRHAGVLILVHQQVAVLILVEFPHVRVIGQQLHGLINQIVKIERTGLFQLFLVGCVDAGGLGALHVSGVVCKGLLRADQLILPAAHLVDGSFDGQKFIVDAQLFIYRFHHTLGIVGVVDGKAAGVADLLCPAAQDAHTGRVEGGGKHFVPFLAAQHPAQTFLQFPCRLVGKGNGHHVPAAHRIAAQHPVQPAGGIGTGHDGGAQGFDVLLGHRAGRFFGAVRRAEPDEVGNAVDQHGGLAAAGTGKDEQRAVRGKHSLPLHIVQAAELLFNVSITQGAEFLPERCCHGFTCFLRCYSYRIV